MFYENLKTLWDVQDSKQVHYGIPKIKDNYLDKVNNFYRARYKVIWKNKFRSKMTIFTKSDCYSVNLKLKMICAGKIIYTLVFYHEK